MSIKDGAIDVMKFIHQEVKTGDKYALLGHIFIEVSKLGGLDKAIVDNKVLMRIFLKILKWDYSILDMYEENRVIFALWEKMII